MSDRVNVTDLLTEPTGAADANWNARTSETIGDAVLVLANQRAGQSILARFHPGELATRARTTEDEIHDAILALADGYLIGSESHPEAIVMVSAIPEYQGPPPEPVPVPDDQRVVTIARRNGKWASVYTPTDSKIVGVSGASKDEFDDEGDE